jgi:hypothetical protein
MDIEEANAIDELKSMSDKELDLVPFDVLRLQCKIEGCTHFTRVRDYGCHPIYYRPKGWVAEDLDKHNWINVIERFFICGQHWKRFKVNLNPPLKTTHGFDDTGKEKVIY